MKLDKLVYSVREAIRDYGDDSDLSDRFIVFLLDTKRAKLVSQKLNSYTTSIPSTAAQSLCVGLEDASRYKCGIDVTCDTLRRSKEALPKMFDTVTGNSLIAVNSLDILGKPFTVIDAKLIPYVQYSSFNNKVYTFLDDDNFLYVYSLSDAHKLLDCVEVNAVYETPLDLENFVNSCDSSTATTCFTMDSEYPIPGDMVDTIRAMVIDDIVKLKQLKGDSTNDAEDNS